MQQKSRNLAEQFTLIFDFNPFIVVNQGLNENAANSLQFRTENAPNNLSLTINYV